MPEMRTVQLIAPLVQRADYWVYSCGRITQWLPQGSGLLYLKRRSVEIMRNALVRRVEVVRYLIWTVDTGCVRIAHTGAVDDRERQPRRPDVQQVGLPSPREDAGGSVKMGSKRKHVI